MIKKFFIALLTLSLLVTHMLPLIPAAAAEGDSVMAIQNETLYFLNDINNATNNCEVHASRGVNYWISIPKDITLDGESKEAEYHVTVAGDIAGTQIVKVVPDRSFVMNEAGAKESQTATVAQEKTAWTFADTMVKNAEGTAYIGTTTDGLVSAPITAGQWSGHFFFNISMLGTIDRYADLDIKDWTNFAPGLYDENDQLVAMWGEEEFMTYDEDYEMDIIRYDLGEYIDATYPAAKTLILPVDINDIFGDYALSGCSSVDTIVFPEGVTELGNGVIVDCPNIERIYLPSSIELIAPFMVDENASYAFTATNFSQMFAYNGEVLNWLDLYDLRLLDPDSVDYED